MFRPLLLSALGTLFAACATTPTRAALADAEAQACAGVPANDRNIGPFEGSERIVSVAPLYFREFDENATVERMVGAVVTLRATPGMTSEWLQRVVNCHMARNAALGRPPTEMSNSPLAPRGVAAHVRSAGDGFAVEIESDDPAIAREVLARAERLYESRPTLAQDTL